MKKLLLALLILPLAAHGQTGAINGYCNLGGAHAVTSGLSSSNFQQGIIPKCTVTVYLTGTTTLATITSGPASNPFTANTDGSWLFFVAANQGYDIVMSGGVAPNTYPSPKALTDVFPSSQFIAPGVITLQTNGVNNSDQTYQDLDSGNGTVVTNTAGGHVRIDATTSLEPQVVPPITGQYVVVYPTTGTITSDPLATGVIGPSSGTLAWFCSNGIGLCTINVPAAQAHWTGFTLPSYVSPSSVTAVYVDAVSNGSQIGFNPLPGGGANTTQFSCSGSGASLFPTGNPPSAPWVMQEVTHTTSLTGTTLSSATCSITLGVSNLTTSGIQVNVAAVRLLVYYTGTAPPTDTNLKIAPPLSYISVLNTLGVDTTWIVTAAAVDAVGALTNSTSGNAGTATALAATPSLCSTGNAPTGVLSNGNATGCAPIGGGGVSQILAGTNISISPAGGTGVVTINSSGGGSAIAGPLQVPNLFSAVNQPNTLSPFTVQANTIFNQNYFQFSDGTAGEFAAPFYSSYGTFIDDTMLHCQMNPGKCSASLLANLLAKWDTAYSGSMGYPIAIAQNLSTLTFCSGMDVSCQNGTGTATGDGRIMVPQALYLYCQKEGIGSTQCTTAYNAYVAHIKAAWALVPRDGTTHLYTVPTGPGSGAASEFVCGLDFMEYMRNTGAVANCNVYAAIVDADMQSLATAAGDSTNASFFASDLALLVTGIRATFINGTTGLLKAATIQNSTNDDIPTSAVAVDCDLDTTVFAACGILTSAQKTTIENYFHTNFSTLTNAAGFVLQTPKAGGWTTIGSIPAGGGPPYGPTGFTNTQYQGGFWTFHAGWFANALGQINQAQVGTLLTNFLGTADPGCEYFNQGAISCSGATSNLESPAWAVSINNLFPLARTVNAGNPVMNKYGAITGTSTAPVGASGTGIGASGAPSLSLTATIYIPAVGGGGLSSTTEANVQVPAPGAAPLSNLYVQLSTAPGTGNSVALTLRDNAANTALTCTISNTATACSDTTHSVSVAQGDLLTISAVPTGTIAATPNLLTSLSWPNGPGVNINTSPVGYFIPAWIPGTNTGVTVDGGIVGTVNQVLVTQFVLPYTITVRQMSWQVTNAVGSSVMAAGIYDSSGNKLVAADNVSSATTGIKTTAVGPVTLTPGVYYFAQCSNSLTAAATDLLVNVNLSGILNHNATKRQGSAANAMSSGVLPSTLGAISAALVDPMMTLLEP